MRAADLTGAALDWAVAKCEGCDVVLLDGEIVWRDEVRYSTDWAQGGPIIERKRIELRGDGDDGWIACDNLNPEQTGATPLIAAMRCYVASKLGGEIELPEELMTNA